jgi:hypothetical protein
MGTTPAVEQPLITVTHQTDPQHRVQVSFNGTWLQRQTIDKTWHAEDNRVVWAIATTTNDGLVAFRYRCAPSNDNRAADPSLSGAAGDYLVRFATFDEMAAAIVPEGYPETSIDWLRKDVMWLRVEHHADW